VSEFIQSVRQAINQSINQFHLHIKLPRHPWNYSMASEVTVCIENQEFLVNTFSHNTLYQAYALISLSRERLTSKSNHSFI